MGVVNYIHTKNQLAIADTRSSEFIQLFIIWPFNIIHNDHLPDKPLQWRIAIVA